MSLIVEQRAAFSFFNCTSQMDLNFTLSYEHTASIQTPLNSVSLGIQSPREGPFKDLLSKLSQRGVALCFRIKSTQATHSSSHREASTSTVWE